MTVEIINNKMQEPKFGSWVVSLVYPATSLETPQNTNDRMLIIRKILVLFSIALIKFIHSFDVDIDTKQNKPLVRTFYAETRCALLISGTSKTLDKRVTSLKKKPLFT